MRCRNSALVIILLACMLCMDSLLEEVHVGAADHIQRPWGRILTAASSDVPVKVEQQHIDIEIPTAISSGYDPRCDPRSNNFKFRNRAELKEEGLTMSFFASYVGLLKAMWVIFKLTSSIIFPPDPVVSPAQNWKVRSTRLRDLDPYKNPLEEVSKICYDEKDPFFGMPFAEPLAILLPSLPTFDRQRALAYFKLRLNQPAKSFGMNLPWSMGTQNVLFLANVLQMLVEMFKLLWHAPQFYRFYTAPWFFFTFRVEFYVDFMLPLLRFCIVQSQLGKLSGEHGENCTICQCYSSGPLRHVVMVPFWLGMVMLGIVIWPWVPVMLLTVPSGPAVLCCLGWCCESCCYDSFSVLVHIFNPEKYPALFLSAVVLTLAWTIGVCHLISQQIAVSAETYLCSFSRLVLISKAPESVSGFFFIVGIVSLILIGGLAMLASLKCVPQILTPDFMMHLWLWSSKSDGPGPMYEAFNAEEDNKLQAERRFHQLFLYEFNLQLLGESNDNYHALESNASAQWMCA